MFAVRSGRGGEGVLSTAMRLTTIFNFSFKILRIVAAVSWNGHFDLGYRWEKKEVTFVTVAYAYVVSNNKDYHA
jgi:hypothetical protein